MLASGRGLSIERRLPLVMTAVLVAVLAASLYLTYRTLAATARSTASARLGQVARLLATSAEQTNRQRTAVLLRLGRDTALVRALRRIADSTPLPAADREVVRATLRRAMLPSDSGLPTALFSADGRRVAAIGHDLAPNVRPEMPEAPEGGRLPPRRGGDSVRVSAPYASGGRVYYQMAVPVVDEENEQLGYVVMLRRVVTNPTLPRQLRDLSGEDAMLYVHQSGSDVWTALDGSATTPPRALGGGMIQREDGAPRLTADAPIRGTPWIVTLEESLPAVLRRPRELLLNLALLSGFLTVAGVAASWAIGRRVTRPLVSLTAAAEAIARGDYRSRVPTDAEDEVGRLAHSFNAMTAEIEASQRELAQQYGEARAAAEKLEHANRRLRGAMLEVEEARDAAVQANRAKSDFLAVMSHELRTPLNAIGGYAELLEMGIYGSLTDEQARAVARITRSQQHLLGLINDVLSFAKLNAAKVQYDIRDVSVAEALGSVEAMIAPQLQTKSLHYRCDACDASLAVRADREKLQQILLNLLSNAVKFTPERGAVTVQCMAVGDAAHVSITDTGVGIPADRLAHIFEPFVQLGRALNRPHEGVGLGLAISHDLALAMGGTILVESAVGAGSAFTLVLPRAPNVTATVERRTQSVPAGRHSERSAAE